MKLNNSTNFKLFTLVLIIAMAIGATAQNCGNVGVENGDFAGWQGFTGKCTSGQVGELPLLNLRTAPIIFTTPQSYQDTISGQTDVNRLQIMTPTSGVGGYDSIIPFIPVVSPYGGTRSIRLGNWKTLAHSESLRFNYLVDSGNTNFIFQYAVILEDPSHPQRQAPAFRINITDTAGNLISPSCGMYEIFGGQTGVGFSSYTPPGFTNPISYINWTLGSLDLTAFIGQNIVLNFSTNDCSLSGHFGYAYIDFTCQSLNFNTLHCSNAPTATVVAPQGYSVYSWTANTSVQYPPLTGAIMPAGSVLAVNDTLQINVNDTTTTYTCNIVSNIGIQCMLNLNYKFKASLIANQSGNLSSVINGPGTTYQWLDCGTNAPIIGATSEVFQPNASGYYSVITNQNSCVDTSSCSYINFVNNTNCLTPTISATNTFFCYGDTVVLTSNIPSVVWNQGSVQSQYFIVQTSGNYFATNASSACFMQPQSIASSNTISIVIDTISTPNLQASNLSICNNLPVNLVSSQQQNYVSYQWSNGAINAFGNTAQANVAGNYFVTVTNANGCTAQSQNITLTQINLPIPSIIVADSLVCTPQTIVMQSSLSQGSYTWFLNGVANNALGNTNNSIATATGNYSLKVVDGGCASTSANLFLQIIEPPTAQINIIQDTLPCSGSLQFSSGLSSNQDSVQWIFGDNSPTVHFQNPTHTYHKSGIYNVKLIAKNVCGTDTANIQLLICSTINVDEISSNNFINVLPNPFDNELKISVDASKNSNFIFELYDVAGKLVLQQLCAVNGTNAIANINTTAIKQGLYLANISNNGFSKRFKLIKN